MYIRKIEGPRVVTSEDGRVISRADLPPAGTRRWVARRKALVVDAVQAGLISKSEALTRYKLSEDEFAGWEFAASQQGQDGLKANRQKALVALHSGDSQHAANAIWKFEDLAFDASFQDATLSGRRMHLTGIEFRVLSYLARNCGKIVSRAELMRHLYGQGPVPGMRILNVVICRLRAKLAEVGEEKTTIHIETVWGRGYALHGSGA